MNIDLEKDIVQSLSSLYPLQEFEERAIDTVLNAIPKWIPVTKPPKESGKYLVTAVISFIPDHVDDPNTYEAVTTANYLADIRDHPIKWCGNNVEKVLAWMPLPEPFKGVTE